MATMYRNRERVSAFRRAPDGSAFEKCEGCGRSGAIALTDMHECEPKKGVKREGFVKTNNCGTMIEIDRKGFETWKNMSKEERQPFVLHAQKLESAYQKALDKEVNVMIQVDDEADSAMLGKIYKSYQFCCEEHSNYSEYCSRYSDDWFTVEE